MNPKNSDDLSGHQSGGGRMSRNDKVASLYAQLAQHDLQDAVALERAGQATQAKLAREAAARFANQATSALEDNRRETSRKDAVLASILTNEVRLWPPSKIKDEDEIPLARGILDIRYDSLGRTIYDIGPGDWIFRAEEVASIEVRFGLNEIDIYLG